jgi:phosphotriesterase-related protein
MLGDIDPEQLGFTYSHEHIVCRPEHWVDCKENDLLLDDPEKSKGDVLLFKQAGGKTIVDATAYDYGRNVKAVRQISKDTGVQIIATAGFNKGILWDAHIPGSKTMTYAEWIDKTSIEELTDFIVREVEVGIEGTDIRGGQIKFGTSYNIISPLEVKTIRAAARAHHITKAPVHSHSECGTMTLEQIDILKQEGVDLENVSFGHLDRNPDTYNHLKIADTGAFLCFDGIGKIKYGPESMRIGCILELVKRGYSKQILISGDLARKSYYHSYLYGIGLDYIIKKWIPRFIEEADTAGYSGKKLVEDFFINNPKRCFTFKK